MFRMSHTGDSIHISLSEPVKLSDKFGSYISYRVSTSTNKTIFSSKDFYVTRRFRDFVWLSQELSRLFPGTIVPALPEKQTVGRFSSDFVETRQRRLERFLARVAANVEMGNSRPFVLFLEGDDTTLNAAMVEVKASKPKMSTTAFKMFESTINTIQNSGKAEIEKSAADLQVEDLITYTNALEKQLQQITKHAENWIRKCDENATSLSELGQSLSWLQHEGDASLLGEMVVQLGKMTEKVAVDGTAHAERQVLQTEEPLQEYLHAIAGVRIAIQQRQDKKQVYIEALTEVEVRQTQYNKYQASSSGKSEEMGNQKQLLVTKAQTVADAAKVEYEQVTERLLREADHFKLQKAQDIRTILVKFVELQIEYQQKAIEIWSTALPTLQPGAYNERSSSASSSAPAPPSSPPPSFIQRDGSSEYTSFEPEDSEIVDV